MANERTGGGGDDLLMVCVCVFIATSQYLESCWVRYLKIRTCRARNTCESDQLATFDTHY